MRRKKRNPEGADVVGFIAGLALPLALDQFGVLPIEVLAGGEAVIAGGAAALVGASSPGFFRGAAVGAVGALAVGLVRTELRRRAILAAVQAQVAAMQAAAAPA